MSLMGLSMNVSYQACKTVTISDFMSPVPHCHKGGDRIQPFILCFIDSDFGFYHNWLGNDINDFY